MLDGHYFHEGYVTRDLDRAIEILSNLYGMTFNAIEATGRVQTREGPAEVGIRLALGWHRNLEYELLQPLSGYVDFYREFLADDATPRLHHTGILVDDWSRLEADIAAQGLPVTVSGDLGDLKYAYVDTRAQLGHYLEYMWMSDAQWAARRSGAQTAELNKMQRA